MATRADKPNYFQEWRERAEVTQAKMAEETGTTEATISRIESGKVGWTQKRVELMARFLGIPVFQLFMHPDDARILAQYVESARQSAATDLGIVAEPKPQWRGFPPEDDDEDPEDVGS